MKLRDFNGKKVVIMGLGLYPQGSGISAAKFFARRGANVLVTDLKSRKELANQIKLLRGFKIKYVLGKHSRSDFKDADLIMKNPGVRAESKFLKIARENKIPVETDVSLFFSLCPAKIIGVTGTRGKSTTSSLIYEILNSAGEDVYLGGNIQVSPLNFLEKLNKDSLVALELSSWMLESIESSKVSPPIAVITNVMADHLNTYAGMKEYARAKSLIFKFQKSKDLAILNFDNEITRKMGESVKAKKIWFSLRKKSAGLDLAKNTILPGEHNLYNALAAVIVVKHLKISDSIIKKVLKDFKGIPNRLEFIHELGGVKYYNDTTATTPDATLAALKFFKDKNIVLIAGGADKNLEFKELAKILQNAVKVLILLPGTATDKLRKDLAEMGENIEPIAAKSMKEAVLKARELSQSGEIVLLSPGAASFGLFVNEFDRGGKFVKEVKNLK